MEILDDIFVKHPIIWQNFVPNYERARISADQMPHSESGDTVREPVYVISAQKSALGIVDNADLKWKLREPTAKMRF